MPMLGKTAFMTALADTRHWRRAACSGRNPATGETLAIPARRTVHFKVARDLQRQISQPE